MGGMRLSHGNQNQTTTNYFFYYPGWSCHDLNQTTWPRAFERIQWRITKSVQLCLATPFTLRDIHIHSYRDYYTVSTTRRLPEYRSSSDDCFHSPFSAMSHFRCRHFFYDLGVAMFAYGRNTGAITAPEPHSISRHRYVQGFAVVTGWASHDPHVIDSSPTKMGHEGWWTGRPETHVLTVGWWFQSEMSKLQNRAGNFDHRWSHITLSVGRRTGCLSRPQKEYRRPCKKRREEKRREEKRREEKRREEKIRRRTAWAVTGRRALVKISGRSFGNMNFIRMHRTLSQRQ